MDQDSIIVSVLLSNPNELEKIIETNFKDFSYDTNDYFLELEKEYISISIKSNQSDQIEQILDSLLNTYPKLRYEMKIYKSGEKYPCSYRINKQGKKIYTKKQTKFLSLM